MTRSRRALAVARDQRHAITVGGSVAVADGSVTLNADGTLTFAPAEDFNGETAFTYQAGSGLHYQFFDATLHHRREHPDRRRHRRHRDELRCRERWRSA